MSGTRDSCGDAAAYLIGALEPAEAERFRRHLEDCVVCRDEHAALRPIMNMLPLSVPQHPASRKLRRRVMRRVRSEAVSTGAAAPGRQWRPLIRPSRPALAGALAAVLALAAVGGLELSGGGSSVRVIRASVTGVRGTAQLRISDQRAELIVNHLPPPPAGRIYEIWIQRGAGAPSPTRALFSVTASGAADVGVPGDLEGVSTIMVTPEPAGGSLVPTHAPVIVARLA